MREVEMPSERLQKLRELGLVECICLLVQKVGLSPAVLQKEHFVRGNPGSLRSSVKLCFCRPTHRVGLPVTQVENVNAMRRTDSGKARAKQQHQGGCLQFWQTEQQAA